MVNCKMQYKKAKLTDIYFLNLNFFKIVNSEKIVKKL
jgi:hypothetical protein